jgi:hypothetical protein
MQIDAARVFSFNPTDVNCLEGHVQQRCKLVFNPPGFHEQAGSLLIHSLDNCLWEELRLYGSVADKLGSDARRHDLMSRACLCQARLRQAPHPHGLGPRGRI